MVRIDMPADFMHEFHVGTFKEMCLPNIYVCQIEHCDLYR